MKTVSMSLIQFWFDDRAQDLVEYALLVGFLSLAAAGILPGPAQHIIVLFSRLTSLTDKVGTF